MIFQAGEGSRRVLLSLLLGVVWFVMLVLYKQGPLSRRNPVKNTVFGRQDNHSVKQVLLLTQMRSGSSFAGHLLMAAPSTFYTEEPIREFLGGPVEPSTPEKTAKAVALLKDIFLCRFSARPDYYERRLLGMHHHNPETIRFCYQSRLMCWDPATNEVLCHAAQVRLTRVVALDLAAVEPLLRDPELTVYIIHLVRDPRGTLASRTDLQKYFDEKERNITSLCSRYRRDLNAAALIRATYPDR